jgi:ribosomal protein L31E
MGYHKREQAVKQATKKKAAKKKPQTKEVLIIGSFPNAMWLKGVDKNGKQVKINVPKRFSNKLLNKQIKVTQIDVSNEEHYKWEP